MRTRKLAMLPWLLVTWKRAGCGHLVHPTRPGLRVGWHTETKYYGIGATETRYNIALNENKIHGRPYKY